MEALIKLIAIGVGVASLSIFNSGDKAFLATRIAQIVVMCVMGAVLIANIVLRVFEKELFALVFAILQVLGHWIMTLVLILSKDPGAFLFIFVFLMALAEYIRLMFLFLSDNIEIKFIQKPILMVISGVFILAYLAVIVIQIVIWLVQYTP
jgi:hypothetical protein